MKKAIEKGIFVFVETVDNTVSEVVYELLGKANELAGTLGTSVSAVIIGDGSFHPYMELAGYGADYILSVANRNLAQYLTRPYTQVLQQLVKEYDPEIILFGATAIGRDLAPRLSARLSTGLTADCTKLEIDEETRNLLMTRPAFGGNMMATIVCSENRPQMATVRPGVMKKNTYTESNLPEVVNCEIENLSADMDIEIIETVLNPPVKQNIREAKVLVSGGRGMGSANGFETLETLANMLGGTVSASRAAVDAGWQTKDRQVGQTGQTVRPDLYIACGISGAIQHVAGMEESEYIIAINKDEAAEIFNIADFGIVGAIDAILPALVDKLKNAMK